MNTATTFGAYPEGVYRDGVDGKLYRKVKRLKFNESGPVYELIPRPVVLTTATDDDSIHEAREKAAKLGHDFYDPRVVEGQTVGWLAYGRKRQEDWNANLGAGVVQYETIPADDVVMPASKAKPAPSVEAVQEPVLAGGKAK